MLTEREFEQIKIFWEIGISERFIDFLATFVEKPPKSAMTGLDAWDAVAAGMDEKRKSMRNYANDPDFYKRLPCTEPQT